MMAKRRMIAPQLWDDEKFGLLSDKAKILFIACVSNADDEGKLSANFFNLRAFAFRFNKVSITSIKKLVKELENSLPNFKIYEVNGNTYVQLLKWKEYQTLRADRLTPSKIPDWQPNDNQTTTKKQADTNLSNVSNVSNVSKDERFSFIPPKEEMEALKTKLKNK